MRNTRMSSRETVSLRFAALSTSPRAVADSAACVK
jgi:hypothetical protein